MVLAAANATLEKLAEKENTTLESLFEAGGENQTLTTTTEDPLAAINSTNTTDPDLTINKTLANSLLSNIGITRAGHTTII